MRSLPFVICSGVPPLAATLQRLMAPPAFDVEGLTLGRREQRAVRSLLAGRSPAEACADAGLPLTREDGKRMTTGEGVEFLAKLERLRSLE